MLVLLAGLLGCATAGASTPVTGTGHPASATSLISAFDPTPAQQLVLPGSPIGIQPSPDGKYVFVGLAGSVLTGPAAGGTQLKTVEGIAVLAQDGDSAHLTTVLDSGEAITGFAITPDGQYLLAAVQPDGQLTDSLQIFNLQKAEAGDADALVATVYTGPASGPALVQLSKDGKYAFVSDEVDQNLKVINIASAIATNGGPGSVVGTLGIDLVPVGEAISPDGKYLYLTNEESYQVGGSPTQCGGLPQGSLEIFDVAEAEAGSNSALLRRVGAGCEPVRVEPSADGSVIWVSSRSSNQVVAYSATKLLTDPTNAVISRTPVGSQPVDLQLFDNGQLLAVANSNRSANPPSGTLSILDTATALSGGGTAATLLNQPAGLFPRQLSLSPDGRLLYLSEYDSDTLEIFNVNPTPAPTSTTTTTTTTKPCTPPKRLTFFQHPAAPIREIKAVIEIDGARYRTVTGRRITRVTLTRPKARTFRLRIVTTLSDGEVIAHSESYSGCTHSRVRIRVLHP